jgi:hypothetical protein
MKIKFSYENFNKIYLKIERDNYYIYSKYSIDYFFIKFSMRLKYSLIKWF